MRGGLPLPSGGSFYPGPGASRRKPGSWVSWVMDLHIMTSDCSKDEGPSLGWLRASVVLSSDCGD